MAIKNIATHVNDGGGYNVSGNDKRPVANLPGAQVSAVEGAWDRGERYNGVGSNPLNTGIGAGAGAVAPIVANPPANNNIGSAVEPVVPTTPAVPTEPVAPTTPDPAPTVPTTPSVPPTSEVESNDTVDIVPSGGGGFGGGGGGGAVDSRYEAPQLVSATDQSDYIRAMYEAQRDARLAALETAYNQSLAALEKQAATIPQYYYEAGRQTAGLNAREVQAMNERFNAAGLNTGASGQGALAQNAVFQGNMAGIRQAEANALAEVEADRAALAMQYQNEIKEAILNNESEKAAALYAEMIRVDESIVDTAYRQAGIDMTAQEFQFDVDTYNQGRADAAAEEQRSALEKKAQVLAAYGDFSGFRELGYPESVINAMQAEWNAENGIIPGGGTYTGGGGYSAPDGWTTQDVIDFQKANGLTPDGIWGPQTQGAYEKNGFNSIGGGAASVGAAVTQLQASGESDEVIAAYIAAAVEQGLITPQDAIWLRNG